jgi:hypothetical protein
MEIKTMYLECLHMKFHLKELQKKWHHFCI